MNFDFYFIFRKFLVKKRAVFGALLGILLIFFFYFVVIQKGNSVINIGNSANAITSPQNSSVSTLDETNLSTPDSDGYVYVDIGGSVKNPGFYRLEHGSRIADLISASGGLLESTAAPWFLRNVNQSLLLADQQKVYIPFDWEVYESTQSIAVLSIFPIPTAATTDPLKLSGINESIQKPETNEVSSTTNVATTSQTSPTVAQSGSTNSQQSSSTSTSLQNKDASSSMGTKINVNTASIKELESLSGVGKVTAQKIIDSRPYKNIEELQTKANLTNSVVSKIQNDIDF